MKREDYKKYDVYVAFSPKSIVYPEDVIIEKDGPFYWIKVRKGEYLIIEGFTKINGMDWWHYEVFKDNCFLGFVTKKAIIMKTLKDRVIYAYVKLKEFDPRDPFNSPKYTFEGKVITRS